MESVNVNGVELEYEVRGAGEPVLLIDMLIADCFVPLLAEPALADRYQLIRYHKRGWVGSTHTPPPVSIADHAADAAALLEQLGVRRAHIAGHSTGASIAAQLALDHPEKVHTLALLEPTLVSLPSRRCVLEGRRARCSRHTDAATTRARLPCSCPPQVASTGRSVERCSRTGSPVWLRSRSRMPTPSSESSCPP